MSGAMSDEQLHIVERIMQQHGFPIEIAVLLQDEKTLERVLSIMSKYNIDAFLAFQLSNNSDDEIEPIFREFIIGEAINPSDRDNEDPIGRAIDPSDRDNEDPIGRAIDPSGVAANVEGPIEKFKWLIESKKCSKLEYDCLIAPLTEIIGNESILAQMFEENPQGFRDIYYQHFIQKKNTFRLVEDPITSMAMEFVMRRWH
jgi:hypothetical protein